MARPVRIEFAGAVYHVTSRSDMRGDAYKNDTDFATFLELLQQACERHNWACHAYCLLGNQYQLMIETKAASLSKGMKLLNGSYTQYFNRKYGHAGAVFHGRFKGILVEKSKYMLELCRDVVLNPVHMQRAKSVKEWLWSSYRATAGLTSAHKVLTTDWVLGELGKQTRTAQARYQKYVQEGKDQPSPWQNLKQQIFMGSDAFVEKVLRMVGPGATNRSARKGKGAILPLARYAKKYPDRNTAMVMAYRSGDYSLQAVGEHFDVSYATVSRAVNAFERDQGK